MDIFETAGFYLSEKQKELFEKYYEMLITFNKKFNITAITEKNDVYLKHFTDSLLGAEYINGDFIDIGSGGGFPAIPLKILNPENKAVLLEATGKKCEFLKFVIKELDIKGAEVINARAEDLAHDKNFREKFSFSTARAVAPLPSLCEYCLPFVKTGGYFVAYKGAENEIDASDYAVKTLGGKIQTVKTFDLSGNVRTVIAVKKEKPTDSRYPRTNAKIRKEPLLKNGK